MLHEAVHSLGFGSLIDQNGYSKLGQSNNYFARYDLFLKDHAGNPLLAGPSYACSSSSLSFQGSTSVISPQCNTNIAVGITNCTAAVQYSSANVNNVSVYTPVCWVGGSSLSHFEDLCSTPLNYANSCSTTANPSNSFNDLYYVMSDASSTGTCFLKRYLKPEERFALCDLGYSVKTTYSCSAVSPLAMIDGTAASHSYGGSSCPGLNIWGQHDGLVNGVFTFTALSSSTNAIALPITSSITANDATTTVGMSCIEVVYNNATYAISGSSLVVTTTSGYNGLVLLKYLPTNSNGDFGNPTYIYLYFLPGNCNPPDACNMVQNGGFEYSTVGMACGIQLGNLSFETPINCWDGFSGSVDVFRRGCPSPGLNLGTNTYSINTPVDSYNGYPNDAVIGFSGNSQAFNGETPKGNLSSPLTPNTTYQASLWIFNSTDPHVSSAVTPIVVALGSLPNFAATSTAAINVLTDFTVSLASSNMWTHLTHTFVYTPTVNNSAIVVYIDGIKTFQLGYIGNNGSAYCFIDDVSIVPMPSPTFSIPNANLCGNTSFTNLAQYASPIPGVFSGTGVSVAGTGTAAVYNFNQPGTNLPAGNYPIYFTYTTSSGCINVLQENVSVSPNPTITASSSNLICSNLNILSTTLTASCSSCGGATSFAWQPALVTGTSIVVSPTISTIYTLTPIGSSCIATQTLAVTVQTQCCTQTITTYPTPSVMVTSTLSSATKFNSDLTVTSGGWLTLSGAEFLFAPNVKIIVKPGAVLSINGAHLYACGTDLWKGIVVENGGKVRTQVAYMTSDNLIEDAATAIGTTGTLTNGSNLIDIHRTTFNKNYIDIDISDYPYTNAPGVLTVDNCVFTCRNLSPSVTPTSWPQTGISGNGLRAVINSTTGLLSPYISQTSFSTTTLKNPYSNQPSHIAIQINSVGVNSGTTMYGITIGEGTTTSNFNLFDSHGSYIFAKQSNVTILNNVFQNTQTYTITGGSTFGGSAITHSVSNILNTALMLTATNMAIGNKFWNCHKAVDAYNVHRFWMEYCIVRSAQSSTANPTSFLPGNTGVNISTNRFDYYLAFNEFTNIKTGINIPVTVGSFTPATCFNCAPFGVYANRIRIDNNTFGTGTVTNTYMDKAINLMGFSNTPWSIPPSSVTPFTQGLIVTNNTLTNVFRGLNINGVTGVQVDVEANVFSLKDESSTPNFQYAINLVNAQPASSTSVGKNIVASNTASFSSSPTNTLGGLIFCGQNGISLWSPSVTCNNLQQGAQGFVFDGTNNHAVWAGNVMTTPINRGMALTNVAVIGVQGGSNTTCSDQWVGGASTWTGGNFGTYVGSGSTATNSVLYVTNTSSCTPPNPDGPFSTQNYNSGTGFYTISVSGDYNCSEFPNNRIISLPRESDYTNADLYYMDKTFLYRFLHFNDSVRTNNSEMAGFYSGISGSSIDKFMQVEDYLYQSYTSEAASLINGMDASGFNTIEYNYKAFYNLYIKYLNGSFTASDGTTLYNLALLCPGDNGTSVYQAIALYNTIYNQVLFSDCSGSEGARKANIQQALATSEDSWDVGLFPNPATDQLTIVSKNESEVLKVVIKDLSNRLIETHNLKTSDFFAKLDISLMNGVYLISVTNTNNEKVIKKLIIAK